jgi:pimeloyl-ACP methyl ester carboxylesterase
MASVVLGSGELGYDVDGEGPAVVLVHEGIADRRMWEPQVEPFVAAGYRVVRYDLRGFGESELPDGPFSNLDDLHGLLEHLGIERAKLVGVSYGGRIALELAIAYPERVEALVLVGAGLRDAEWSDEIKRFGEEEESLLEAGNVEGAVEVNLRMWVDGPSRGPDEVDHGVRERVREMQRLAFEVQLAKPEAGPEAPFDPPASTRLDEVRAPTLVVVGELDQPDMLRIADRLANGIPGARKAVIPGTAHVPSMEKPDEFNELVLGFLRTG